MSLKENELYEFGEFRLDVTEHFLARLSGGEPVQLSEKAPKSFKAERQMEPVCRLPIRIVESKFRSCFASNTMFLHEKPPHPFCRRIGRIVAPSHRLFY